MHEGNQEYTCAELGGATCAPLANPQDSMEEIAMNRAKSFVKNNFRTLESLDEVRLSGLSIFASF